jgi:hypothetical protein
MTALVGYDCTCTHVGGEYDDLAVAMASDDGPGRSPAVRIHTYENSRRTVYEDSMRTVGGQYMRTVGVQ